MSGSLSPAPGPRRPGAESKFKLSRREQFRIGLLAGCVGRSGCTASSDAFREEGFLVERAVGQERDRQVLGLPRQVGMGLQLRLERGETQRVLSSRVFGITTIRASDGSIRQQVWSAASRTSLSVGRVIGIRAAPGSMRSGR